MKVSREEILHIAKLANLNLKEEEIDNYILNLQDILNFANIVNNAPVEGLSESIGVNNNYNVFRRDEIVKFEEAKKKFNSLISDCYGIIDKYPSEIFRSIIDKLRARILG